jgi:hypothetical protein
VEACTEIKKNRDELLARWAVLTTKDLKALNSQIRQFKNPPAETLPEIKLDSEVKQR